MITSRYPTTTFTVSRSVDPPGTRVLATVDVDEVLEVSLRRLAQLDVGDGLPLSVIPVQPYSRRGDAAGSWLATRAWKINQG